MSNTPTLRCLLIAAILTAPACSDNAPLDEAMAAGKTKADFPTASADVFAGMDDGIQLTPEEIKGRNTWMLWAGDRKSVV